MAMDDRFARFCDALRRNDSNATEFALDPEQLSPGYGVELGEALIGNDTLTKLNLHVRLLLAEVDTSVAASAAAAAVLPLDRLSSLISFIKTSQRLNEVSLYSHAPEGSLVWPNLCGAILRCLSINPHIEVAHFEDPPPVDFAYYLRTTTSLRSLHLTPGDCGSSESSLVADALRSNRTIQSLRMISGDEECTDNEVLILQALYAHPTLREVYVGGWCQDYTDYLDALVGLIRSTNVLNKVGIGFFAFDEDDTAKLIDALQHDDSISKLVFGRCYFSEESEDDFVAFLSSDRVLKRIRELEVVGGRFFAPGSDETSFVSAASLAVSTSMDVESLTVSELDNDDDDDAFIEKIPQFVRVKSLCVGHFGRDLEGDRLVQAVRQNGSIHQFSRQDKRHASPPLSQSQWERIQIYCERNKRLPELLTENRTKESTEPSDFAMFPALFVVARPAHRMTPNSVLNGLLMTSRSPIGTTRGAKRVDHS